MRPAYRAAGAEEGPHSERQSRHAGVRNADQGDGRGSLRGVADADVSGDDELNTQTVSQNIHQIPHEKAVSRLVYVAFSQNIHQIMPFISKEMSGSISIVSERLRIWAVGLAKGCIFRRRSCRFPAKSSVFGRFLVLFARNFLGFWRKQPPKCATFSSDQ